MENAQKKNAPGKERSRSSRGVTIAVHLFLAIGLVGATDANAMIRDTDYRRTIKWMAGAQKRVKGTTPEAPAAQGENAETAPASSSARSRVSMPEAVPSEAETSKQPAAVQLRAVGNEHETSTKE